MDCLPSEISLVTFNCWGLRFISKWRSERILEIARRLSSTAPCIVALQELWSEDDYEILRKETRAVLPYGKRYHAGVVGSGLAILSRWPIEESSLFRFPLNGRPTAFFRGDWYAGKGVAHARIRYGPLRSHIVEVFNTHTHAVYEPAAKDSYAAHRAAQAWYFAKLLRGAAERGHLVVGLCDLNAPPSSLPRRIVTAHAPVRDAWRVLHHSYLDHDHHDQYHHNAESHPARHQRRPPTADFNLRQNGVTCGSVLNTWCWDSKRQKRLGPAAGGSVITRKGSRTLSLVEVSDLRPEQPRRTARWQDDDGVPANAPDPDGQRIDYVFAGTGSPPFLGGVWTVKNAKVGMVQRHRDLGCSLSDHFSVEVTLKFHSTTPGSLPPLDDTRPKTAPPRAEAEKVPIVEPLADPAVVAAETSPPVATSSPEPPPVGHDDQVPQEPQSTASQNPGPAAKDDDDDDDGATFLVGRGTYLSSPAASLSEAASARDDQELDEHPEQTRRQLARSNTITGPVPMTASAAAATATAASASASAAIPCAPPALYDEVLALTASYTAREEAQQLWRAFHLFSGVLFWLGCCVAVWFVPPALPYVSFLLVLLGAVSLAAASVDGLIALVFVSSELRALREFEWEVTNSRAASAAAAAVATSSAATAGVTARQNPGRLADRSHAISTTTAATSITKNF